MSWVACDKLTIVSSCIDSSGVPVLSAVDEGGVLAVEFVVRPEGTMSSLHPVSQTTERIPSLRTKSRLDVDMVPRIFFQLYKYLMEEYYIVLIYLDRSIPSNA